MRQYYFKANDGNEYGPVTAQEVKEWQLQGRMNSESHVRYSNSREWKPLGSYPELASASAPEPPPVKSSEPIPTPTHQVPPQQSAPTSSTSGHSTSQTQQAGHEPHRGGLILGFGITSLVFPILCCYVPLGIFFGVPAWIMGSADMRKINAGEMDPAGKGSTKAGLICGIIGTFIALGIILLLTIGILVDVSNR